MFPSVSEARVSLLVLHGGSKESLELDEGLGDLAFVEAKDVRTAVEALRTRAYDCALFDLRSPAPDCLGVLRVARAEGLRVPIIVLAARADDGLAIELMQSGAIDYISPSSFSSERLRQSIELAIRLRRAELAADRERQRLGRLQGFTATLATRLTVAEVAESTTAALRSAFNAPRALFAMMSNDDESIHILRADGFPESVISIWRQIPVAAELPLAESMRLTVPLFFEDSTSLMARYPHLEKQRVEGDEALFVVPLGVEGRAIGVVALIYGEARPLSDDDHQELLALARVCGQALDRAYLFDVAQLERRRAEEANRAKDDFLAMISHELRTPLSAILGWAQMLNTGSLNVDQTRKATGSIERNAIAQAQLIDDLLDVSRIINGQMRIKWEPVDLAVVLEAALDVVRPAADAKGVLIQQDFDHVLGFLLGDANRLQQVFWNLLSNAVKFTPRGGRVAVRLFAADSSYVVEVHDTGQGIPADLLPLIFQRFRQGDVSIGRTTGGLGLGLAIVRHLVELHGGEVDASSDGLGKGTTLIVRLPINAKFGREPSERAPVSQKIDIPPRGSPHASTLALTGIRVLVVDDDVDARDLITAVLVARSAQVTAVATAREALECMQVECPHVLVSDIGMPVEDGYALMERVRALPAERGGRTPAIALTAYARNSDRARALLAGYTAHATKPMDPDELVLLIATLVGTAPPPATELA